MKLQDAVAKWPTLRPSYFLTAGNHPFECTCNDCVTWLLESIRLYIVTDANRPEDWGPEENTPQETIDAVNKLLDTEVTVDGRWLEDKEVVDLFHKATGDLL